MNVYLTNNYEEYEEKIEIVNYNETSQVIVGVVPFNKMTFEQVFRTKNANFNEEEAENPFYRLKETLSDRGITLVDAKALEGNSDIFPKCIFYFGEIRLKLIQKFEDALQIYFAFEPPAVESAHFPRKLLKNVHRFDYTFTWDDEIVDGVRFIKFNYPVDFSIKKLQMDFEKRKLLTNISANKRSKHPDELYSKRLEGIRYFTQNEPSFEFYGSGWDEYQLDSYRGFAPSKREILSKYKFSLCFENQQNIKGYVTEKIHECILCGAVPVYLGATNIEDYVPKDCYIDFREFNSWNALHVFLSEMDSYTWNRYIENGEKYIKSTKKNPFTSVALADVIEDIVYKEKAMTTSRKTIADIWLWKKWSRMQNIYSSYRPLDIVKKLCGRLFLQQHYS